MTVVDRAPRTLSPEETARWYLRRGDVRRAAEAALDGPWSLYPADGSAPVSGTLDALVVCSSEHKAPRALRSDLVPALGAPLKGPAYEAFRTACCEGFNLGASPKAVRAMDLVLDLCQGELYRLALGEAHAIVPRAGWWSEYHRAQYIAGRVCLAYCQGWCALGALRVCVSVYYGEGRGAAIQHQAATLRDYVMQHACCMEVCA